MRCFCRSPSSRKTCFSQWLEESQIKVNASEIFVSELKSYLPYIFCFVFSIINIESLDTFNVSLVLKTMVTQVP